MKKLNDVKKENVSKVMDVWKNHNGITNPNELSYSLDIIDQIAATFSSGVFYYYVFNFETLTMEYVHHTIKDVLGVEPEEFTIDKLFSLYHPEDLAKLHEKENAASEFLFNKLDPKDLPFYKVVYVTRCKDVYGNYKKILHQAKAINVTDDGKIQQVIGVHTDISYLSTLVDHKISFIGSNSRPSYFKLDPSNLVFEKREHKKQFTTQELRIIQLIAEGKGTDEIATNLNLSPHTIKSHRKNILKKTEANNTVQLIANCIRNGII